MFEVLLPNFLVFLALPDFLEDLCDPADEYKYLSMDLHLI